MDMYDVEVKMEEEVHAEKVEFAKALLRRKSDYIENLSKVVNTLKDELDAVAEEYDDILSLSIEEAYGGYYGKPMAEYVTLCLKTDVFEVCG